MKKLLLFSTAILAGASLIFAQSKTAAAQFDGVDDRIVIPHDNSLVLGRSAFTIEVWIKADTGNNSQAPTILSKKKSGAPSTSGWLFGMTDQGKLALQMKGTNFYPSPFGGGPGAPGVTAIDLRDGQCHHIAWTRMLVSGEEDEVNGYQDGAYVKRTRDTTAGNVDLNGTEDLWMGGSDFNTGQDIYQYKGFIKEIRIWNYAKTESEIFNDKNKHLAGNETGLIAYWRLNENTGTLAYECVNDNHGTLTNGATWNNSFCDNLSNAAPAKCDGGGGPTGISESDNSNLFVVYPNPLTNELRLINESAIDIDRVTVYDLNGKIVIGTNWNGKDALNVAALNSGTYLIELYSGQNQVFKSLISKE